MQWSYTVQSKKLPQPNAPRFVASDPLESELKENDCLIQKWSKRGVHNSWFCKRQKRGDFLLKCCWQNWKTFVSWYFLAKWSSPGKIVLTDAVSMIVEILLQRGRTPYISLSMLYKTTLMQFHMSFSCLFSIFSKTEQKAWLVNC